VGPDQTITVGPDRVDILTALKPTPLAVDEHLVCFTDDSELQVDGWEVRVVKPTHPHPRMSAKYYKLMSHEVLPEFDQTLWLDGTS
jgi:hypothetical protein